MADLNKTIQIVFKGDDSDLSKVMDGIPGKFKGFDDMVGKIAEPFAKAAEAVLVFDAALAALAVGGMAYAIKVGAGFQTQFNEIATVAGADSGAIDKFRGNVLTYAQDSGKSIGDINNAIYNAISAGVKYDESLNLLSTTEKLSSVTRTELGDTTKLVASVLNAYGENTDQATKYSDILFTSVKGGQMRMNELNTALAQVTMTAASAGVPFDDLMAAIMALTGSGLPANQAVTGLKAAISNIIKPTSDATETADALGIQFDLAGLKSKGLAGFLAEVQAKTGGNVTEMAKLFGSVEGLNVMLALAADKSGKFAGALEAMKTAGGSVADAYKLVQDDLEKIWQKIVNNAEAAAISFYYKLLPQFKDTATGLGKLFEGIKVAIDEGAFDPVFTALGGFADSFAAYLKKVADAVPGALGMIDWSKLIEAIQSLGNTLFSFLGGLDLTKPEDLGKVFQRVVDIITVLVKVTEGMAEAFKPVFEAMMEFFEGLANGDEESKKTLGTILAMAEGVKLMGTWFVAAMLIIDEYKISVGGLFNIIAGGVQLMFNGFQILIDLIIAGVGAAAYGILELADTLTLGLVPGIGNAKKDVEAGMERVKKSIIDNSYEARTGLDKLMAGFQNVGTETGQTEKKAKSFGETVTGLPKESKTKITVDAVDLGPIEKALPAVRPMEVKTGVDYDAVTNTFTLINKGLPPTKDMSVKPAPDYDALGKTKKDMEGFLNLAVQMDMKQLEALTEWYKASTQAISAAFTSSGSVIQGLTSAFENWSSLSVFMQSALEQAVISEMKNREKLTSATVALTESQIKYVEAKLKKMASGESLITINAQGLEPELEAFMWQILKKIQVRANEEASEFLLGVTA